MNKKDIKISGCILTRNDNQFIKGCINHIIPYVDEIVILDANEDDKTESIINDIIDSSSKPIIYKRTTVSKNFAKDRNELHSMASGDYVLHVDCDETFDTRFLSMMKYVIQDHLNRNILPILFRFPRMNLPDKINYPDYQIRLLNKKYATWTRNVHEIPEIVQTTREEIKEETEGKVGMNICNMVTLDYPIIHAYKEKDKLQERWKELLDEGNHSKKLLVISIFKNSGKWIGKTLQCMSDLYCFNQTIDNKRKLDINFSFIDQNSNDGTFKILENYCREGCILNIQLRNFGENSGKIDLNDKYLEYKTLTKVRNYAIEQSTIGFPLRDDDYILFSDNDVKFDKNVVYELIESMEKNRADIIAPMIYMKDRDIYFYDIVSYKLLNGSQVSYSEPYNIDMSKPSEMSSVGSFYIMKYIVAKNIKYNGEYGPENVEFCNRARSKGFKIFLDPRLPVFHIW